MERTFKVSWVQDAAPNRCDFAQGTRSEANGKVNCPESRLFVQVTRAVFELIRPAEGRGDVVVVLDMTSSRSDLGNICVDIRLNCDYRLPVSSWRTL
jgi:hypothetical protein